MSVYPAPFSGTARKHPIEQAPSVERALGIEPGTAGWAACAGLVADRITALGAGPMPVGAAFPVAGLRPYPRIFWSDPR